MWIRPGRSNIWREKYLFTMLCQFYIVNTNNRYNNTHKNIPHTVSDKAGYMLQPKPITAALTNGHDKFCIMHRTNMKASLCWTTT